MATSTLYHSPRLASPSGSPRSCLYMPRPQPFQPKADWRATFTSPRNVQGVSNREIQEPPIIIHNGRPFLCTKPLILRQQNGIWASGSAEASNKIQPEDCSPQTPAVKIYTEDTTTTQSSPTTCRLTLGRIIKSLKCYVCHATVKESNFQNHLFFGAVRCSLCSKVCWDCRSFERLLEDTELGYGNCKHSIEYSEDPFQYLISRLTGSDDIEVGGSLSLPNSLRILQHYVSKLVSLQLREPWSTALRKCKIRLLKAVSMSSPQPNDSQRRQEEQLQEGSNKKETLESDPLIHEGAEERTSLSDSGTSTPVMSISTIHDETYEADNLNKKEDDGLLLTQNYDLEHLEQAVEYIEVAEQDKMSSTPSVKHKPKKRRQPGHYKKLKSHKLTHIKVKSQCPPTEQKSEETEFVKEDVQFPEDGYYLMVREAVEECPMCYTPLYPKQCTVNLRMFLFTVICTVCCLTIYIVPEVDNGLKIVTDDGSEVVTRQNQKEVKKRRITASDFFAK